MCVGCHTDFAWVSNGKNGLIITNWITMVDPGRSLLAASIRSFRRKSFLINLQQFHSPGAESEYPWIWNNSCTSLCTKIRFIWWQRVVCDIRDLIMLPLIKFCIQWNIISRQIQMKMIRRNKRYMIFCGRILPGDLSNLTNYFNQLTNWLITH